MALSRITSNFDVSFIIDHQVTNSQSYNYDFIMNKKIALIKSQEKGLSKSRNRIINYCKSQYLLISDDDVDYLISNIMTFLNGQNENSWYAACGKVKLKGNEARDFKSYSNDVKRLSKIDCTRVSSVELIINMDEWRKSRVYFDEKFGLGSDFPSGEEFIFLTDIMKNGGKVCFFPVPFVLHDPVSSGQDFFSNDILLIAKVAMFKRVYGKLSNFYIFAFYIKKFRLLVKNGASIRFLNLWVSYGK